MHVILRVFGGVELLDERCVLRVEDLRDELVGQGREGYDRVVKRHLTRVQTFLTQFSRDDTRTYHICT